MKCLTFLVYLASRHCAVAFLQSQGADAYDSDDDDGYLRTDHLVADLSTLPMSTARRHVLAKRTLGERARVFRVFSGL
jgi:hypothetical protein